MPSEPVLDFDELLAPIPGDNPQGSAIPFTLRQELEDARKEESPDDYDPGDPRRPSEFKSADWSAIARSCRDALINTSKDLQLAARLTEAITNLQGFAGLRDGLQLMFLLIDQAWDRLNPLIEEPDDLEVRAAAFNWLDDPDRGALFPLSVANIPLFTGEKTISLLTWRLLQQGKGDINQDAFDKTVQGTSYEACKVLGEDIQGCLEALTRIGSKGEELMGESAPSLSTLRRTVQECNQLMQLILQRKAPTAAESDGENVASEGAESEAGSPAAARAPRKNTREDIYRQLNQLANQLQEIEPHSPIPYLLRKAFELGSLPFPMLIKALVRNDDVLMELNRELGIEDPEEEDSDRRR